MATVSEAVRRLTIEATTRGVKEAAAATRALSNAVDGVAVSSARAEKATQSMESRLGSIQRKYDAAFRAQSVMARVERDLMRAQDQGLLTQQRRLELLSLAAERHGLATAAINRETAATEQLTMASHRLAAANDNVFRRRNLTYQVFDVGQMLALGQNPGLTALQQGPQIAQLYAGQGGVNAALKDTSSIVGGLLTRMGPLLAVTAALGVAIAGMRSEINETSKVQVSFGNTAQAMAEVVARAIYSKIEPAVSAIAPWFEAAWNEIVDATAAGLNAYVRFNEMALETIKFAVASLPDAFIVAAEAAAQGFIDIMVEMARKVLDIFNSIIDGINSIASFAGMDTVLGNLDVEKLLPDIEVALGGAEAMASLKKRTEEYQATLRQVAETDYAGQFMEQVRKEAIANQIEEDEKTKKARERQSEYEREIGQIREKAQALRIEADNVGMSAVEIERLKNVLELENAARKDSVGLTKARVAEIQQETKALAEAQRAAIAAKAADDLLFERAQMGRSSREQEVYAKIRSLGLDINDIEGQRVAEVIRGNQAIEQQRELYEALGDTIAGIFTGGIKSFDEFLDHITKGFAQIGEQNLSMLFDGLLSPANDNRRVDPVGKVAEAVERGAMEGTSAGQSPLVKLFEGIGFGDNSGKMASGASAALGGFGMGYQSQDPLMGAVGGAMSGFAAGMAIGGVGGPVGAIIGGVAGLLGGLFGKSQQKKRDREAAQEALSQSRQQIQSLIDTGMGRGVGSSQQAFRDFHTEAIKAQQLASKAGDHALVNELTEATKNFANILATDFKASFEGTIEALRAGLGADSPFVQAQQRIVGLREDLKGFVADAAFWAGGLAEAQKAAQAYALSQISGAEELTDVQAEMQRIRGTAAALGNTLVQLGMSAGAAAKAIRAELVAAISELRSEYIADLTRSINEIRGNSHLNEIIDAQKRYGDRLKDAAALGLDASLAQEELNLTVAKIVREAGLGADEIARLSAQFPGLAASIESSLMDIRRSFAETMQEFWDSTKINAGLSTLSPTEQLAEARRQFEANAAGALAGDQGSMDRLQGSITAYLEQAKSFFGSSSGYVSAFDQVDALIRQLADFPAASAGGTGEAAAAAAAIAATSTVEAIA
ncbi:MAG: phage tail length tape measure family protein, partial [Bradyrhizobium sp.]|uniref:phage tail length tape measure family protein n=1 Tax=Bradyrhizobium sp. TaxID=376 RepID=UPI003D0DF1D8